MSKNFNYNANNGIIQSNIFGSFNHYSLGLFSHFSCYNTNLRYKRLRRGDNAETQHLGLFTELWRGTVLLPLLVRLLSRPLQQIRQLRKNINEGQWFQAYAVL
jgi:hypothetical protein